MYVEEEPEWNYRVSETSAVLSSDPLGEAAEATAKGKENGMQIISSLENLTHTKAVLDRRPKFYGRSRRFKTYGYGYGGRSLRPFLRPKVLFVVFLFFFQNGG